MLTETGFEDTNWNTLAQGEYLWAVRAVYTSDVISVPVFSNTIVKELTNGTISGFVRSSEGNQAIAGATITAGDQFHRNPLRQTDSIISRCRQEPIQ